MRLRAALPLLLLALPAFAPLAHAQDRPLSLHGRFADATSSAAVSGVQVRLAAFADTSDVHRATAGDDGKFELKRLDAHAYRLEATRLGYAPLKLVIRVTRANQDAGVLALTSESVKIGGITVTESPAPAIVKGDTTEFRASAVKTHPDATAEDLVQKLPGVTMENGQIKAHGEAVQNVLVNGRPFFGSDPTAAMRNLPADVVDRIQVYDRASDQAEFSGFDDGQQQKTMNFILRDQKARFGKVYGGYGDRDLYQTGGNATVVHGATRLTLIGLANNINQRNFSPQDLIGALVGNAGGGGPRIMMFGGPRGGGGGGGGGGPNIIRMGGGFGGGGGFDPSSFFVNQQGGISTTNSGGLNYAGQWGKKLAVSSSVFLNGVDNDNTQTLDRQYLPPQDSIAFYDQTQTTDNRNGNQRIDGRIEWTLDSLNSVIAQPRFYFQNNHTHSFGYAANTTEFGSPVNSSTSDTRNDTHGDNLSNRLTLRHRFARRGRNLSADLSTGHSLRDGTRLQRSLTDFDMGDSTSSDTTDQRTGSNTVTTSFSTRLAYTEPVNKHVQMQLTYNPSVTVSRSDARTLALDPATGTYDRLDSLQSNRFENRATIQNGGGAVLVSSGPWRWLTTLAYQHTQLHSEQTFPRTGTIDHAFEDVLPSMTLSGTFANRRNVRLAWNTSTTPPAIGQLQNVVDNSNPLSLSAGNPDLKETYNHSVSLRISEADPLKSKSRFVFMNLTRTGHTIANSTFTAPNDTTVNGVFLARGTQLTMPVNLDAAWNTNAFAVYSRPWSVLKSIVSLNGGGSFTQTPTRLNTSTNVSKSYALRFGTTLASNVSPRLDFTLSYQGSYNLSRNTLSTSTTGDYYSHTLGLRFNGIARYGIVVRQELNQSLQSGVTQGFGQNALLWNTTLGKKFLKGDRGELRVTVTDVLEQDKSVNRSITETYVQDTLDRTLGRFAQAVFTYTWK